MDLLTPACPSTSNTQAARTQVALPATRTQGKWLLGWIVISARYCDT